MARLLPCTSSQYPLKSASGGAATFCKRPATFASALFVTTPGLTEPESNLAATSAPSDTATKGPGRDARASSPSSGRARALTKNAGPYVLSLYPRFVDSLVVAASSGLPQRLTSVASGIFSTRASRSLLVPQ